jgi:hypothetical protein
VALLGGGNLVDLAVVGTEAEGSQAAFPAATSHFMLQQSATGNVRPPSSAFLTKHTLMKFLSSPATTRGI